MPYSFMHIRPITHVINHFSLVLILNNKFLYTVFRHAHSLLCLFHQSLFISLCAYKITFPIRYSVMHIRSSVYFISRFSLVFVLIK